MGNHARKPATVSRKELYRQVWETPLRHLAARYGINGIALAKICDQLNIPRPRAGHWSKIMAGKSAGRPDLPPANIDTLAQVAITPDPPCPSPPRSAFRPKIRELYERVLREASAIKVPDSLRDPHPAIAARIAKHARLSTPFGYGKSSWQPEPLSKLDDREHRILDTLFKELEKRGFGVAAEPYQTFLQIDRERLDFALCEYVRHVRRPVTEKEKKSPFYSGEKWRHERIPTGNLVFKITTYFGQGVTRQWIDEPSGLLEQKIGEIVAACVLVGALLIDHSSRDRYDSDHVACGLWWSGGLQTRLGGHSQE